MGGPALKYWDETSGRVSYPDGASAIDNNKEPLNTNTWGGKFA